MLVDISPVPPDCVAATWPGSELQEGGQETGDRRIEACARGHSDWTEQTSKQQQTFISLSQYVEEESASSGSSLGR